MKIHDLMIANPITITANASIQDAIEIMKNNSIRHLPVVSGKKSKLAGFVTLSDLKQGLMPSMLTDVSLEDIIIKNPIVVSPDDDVEIAAQLIYNHKIGGMPVVKKNKVVGIITATDILRTFIDMMGLLTSSSRIDLVVGKEPGAFRNVSNIIHENGGDIINVGMTAQKASKRIYYFRLSSCKTGVIKDALEKEGYKVIDATD